MTFLLFTLPAAALRFRLPVTFLTKSLVSLSLRLYGYVERDEDFAQALFKSLRFSVIPFAPNRNIKIVLET